MEICIIFKSVFLGYGSSNILICVKTKTVLDLLAKIATEKNRSIQNSIQIERICDPHRWRFSSKHTDLSPYLN